MADADANAVRPTRTFKLTLAYDGTAFVGWQRQARGVSIQGLVEEALARVEGAPVTVFAAGRTDAGVHARGQVASARLASAIDPRRLRHALNGLLPRDIRVTAIEQVAADFHARHDARAKTYRYLIVHGPIIAPFAWRYCWHVGERLDLAAMAAAAVRIEGEHDFAAFRSTGGSVRTSVRRVSRSRLLAGAEAGGADPWDSGASSFADSTRLVYEVTANGFLRHMVRTLVGTIVEIGTGRLDPAVIDRAFVSGDRRAAGVTAPARGLCLVEVAYDPPVAIR
jgi:tRNA pseudouridine38-40 synthase